MNSFESVIKENRVDKSDEEVSDLETQDFKPEHSLSPEKFGEVMEMIQDINRYNTAFRTFTLSGSFLSRVLDGGIPKGKNTGLNRGTREAVYFNLVGRFSADAGELKPEEATLNKAYWRGQNLLFDISEFKEDTKMLSTEEIVRRAQEGSLTYAPDSMYVGRNERGDTTTNSEVGFISPTEISPKYLRGIVLREYYFNGEPSQEERERLRGITAHLDDLLDEQELLKQRYHRGKIEEWKSEDGKRLNFIKGEVEKVRNDESVFVEKWGIAEPDGGKVLKGEIEDVKLAVKQMTEGGGVIIPIYDTRGNLRWPVYMSHEEIVGLEDK